MPPLRLFFIASPYEVLVLLTFLKAGLFKKKKILAEFSKKKKKTSVPKLVRFVIRDPHYKIYSKKKPKKIKDNPRGS